MPPPQKPILLYGAGGHSTVLLEAAALCGYYVVGIFDDATDLRFPDPLPRWSAFSIAQPELLGAYTPTYKPELPLLLGIGDNVKRAQIGNHVAHRLLTLLHPRGYVAPSARLEPGVMVLAGAVVHTAAHLHEGVLINTNAVVEHHCRVGEFAHLAPGAILCGGVTIGPRSLVGPGVVVEKGITVGADCILAAGAVVVHDVPDGKLVKGVPGAWH
jgi:sugar O-acyltransferase (sialic acid O-acetyltransferase NeuD family)